MGLFLKINIRSISILEVEMIRFSARSQEGEVK